MLNMYKDKLKRSIDLNGEIIKKVVAMEEPAELIQEIAKDLRGEYVLMRMIEEIADTLICIENLKIMYDIRDHEIQGYIDYKVARQVNRDAKKFGADKVMT